MPKPAVTIPGHGMVGGDGPIVIIGPNGSGKTKLAQTMAGPGNIVAISAQRQTWIDQSLPAQEENVLREHVRSQQNRWRDSAWMLTDEISFVLSQLVQEQMTRLTEANQKAVKAVANLEPITDTKLMKLQNLWGEVFPKRQLDITGFYPRVIRADTAGKATTYLISHMSDGERTVLYMAARVLAADKDIILIDEPELHMHSKLAIQFWNQAEQLRPDCRFVYITHDLNFTLSRRDATFLVVGQDSAAQPIVVDNLPVSIAKEVLGAATLPFYAKRIFFFEGEAGNGLAGKLFSVWFNDDLTFCIAAGNRKSVCAAVSGLKKVRLAAADIIGLVDRDYTSDEILTRFGGDIRVLSVHEIESTLCDPTIVAAIATHLVKDPAAVAKDYMTRVQRDFQGLTLNTLIARRVRARVEDLLHGAFDSQQITAELTETTKRHCEAFEATQLQKRIAGMFTEESERVANALTAGGADMLAILPGKHMLGVLAQSLGLKGPDALSDILIQSLNHRKLKRDDPLVALGPKVEAALLNYLPARVA